MGYTQEPTIIYEDNQVAIVMFDNPVQRWRSKHICQCNNFVRQCVRDGDVLLVYVPSKENVSDIFTKQTPIYLYKRQRKMLMNAGKDK